MNSDCEEGHVELQQTAKSFPAMKSDLFENSNLCYSQSFWPWLFAGKNFYHDGKFFGCFTDF